jgi:RHS repeat-associated protein
VGAYLNTSYDYDSMGNRLQSQTLNPDGTLNNRSSYTPNKLNQITQLVTTPQSGDPSTRTLLYDGDGNLTRSTLDSETAATSNKGATYTYDEANRLIAIVQADETTGVNQRKSEFVYDAFSRKVISREYSWDTSVTPAVWKLDSETRRIYDGMKVVQERDAQNNVTVNYTRDGNIGGLLARTVKGQAATATTPATPDQHFFYHYDGSGNVVQLTDAGQQTVAEYSYDAYGNLRGSGGSQAGQPYRYSTKEYHAASGLYDYGYRFYSPSLGRWINRDPIAEQGGLNLYGFVANDPVNRQDADGLSPTTAPPAEPPPWLAPDLPKGRWIWLPRIPAPVAGGLAGGAILYAGQDIYNYRPCKPLGLGNGLTWGGDRIADKLFGDSCGCSEEDERPRDCWQELKDCQADCFDQEEYDVIEIQDCREKCAEALDDCLKSEKRRRQGG